MRIANEGDLMCHEPNLYIYFFLCGRDIGSIGLTGVDLRGILNPDRNYYMIE